MFNWLIFKLGVTVDFARLPNHTSYVSVLEENLPSRKELEEFDELISVYNHGTLEFGSVEHEAEHDLRNKFEINVFSVWSLLAAVNKLIPESVIANQKFVNITSKMADTPKAHWSGHCCSNYKFLSSKSLEQKSFLAPVLKKVAFQKLRLKLVFKSVLNQNKSTDINKQGIRRFIINKLSKVE